MLEAVSTKCVPAVPAGDRGATRGAARFAFLLLLLMGLEGPGALLAQAVAEEAPAPIRIALQAGHWLSAEAPDELRRIRTNGTRSGGREEWEVTLEIAQLTALLLEERGYLVEVLPATIPPGYQADLFIAIHADGFHSPDASGFSVGAPRRDVTGQARGFAEMLGNHYRAATGLRHRVATRRMERYYAFNSRRYSHALDPSTVGVILEAGFMTSPVDQALLFQAPERSARAIVEAVAEFLPLEVRAEAEVGR